LLEDVLTALHTHTPNTHEEQQLAIDRELEIAREGEEVRDQSREKSREARCFGTKVGDGTHPDDAMWVVAEDVGARGRKVGGLRGKGEAIFGVGVSVRHGSLKVDQRKSEGRSTEV
jgi:hypothetical protein